jgi:pyridoxamine 5'-phosphate oxidase
MPNSNSNNLSQTFTKFSEPFLKFDEWFKQAINSKIIDATAFTLATATPDGRPSARILLLKKYNERGFCFFTNYNGRKSIELEKNPHAAMCFYWDVLDKQIRIEGRVEKLSADESDEYFNSRPPESRIGAIVSKQSTELESYEKLLQEISEATKKFANTEIKRPENWGGWRVIPERIEFWQAGQYRIHQREVYKITESNTWTLEKLYP